jgi:DNA-binding transcriptional LysR family regulator
MSRLRPPTTINAGGGHEPNGLGIQSIASWGHVVASKKTSFIGPVDAALSALGLSRTIRIVAPSFPAVIAIAAGSDLIGLAPRWFCQNDPAGQTEIFDLPVATPPIVVSQIWHPRMDADPGHRWLRSMVVEAFR